MSGAPTLLGAVLAGGRSRRFGHDKALARVAGVPLVERAARTLSGVCEQVVVVSSSHDPEGWESIPDLRSDRGPLGGIEAALTRAAERDLGGVLVLACDLPLVTEGTLRALAIAADGAQASAPAREGSPPVEPLCAVYRTSCLPALRALLDAGERRAGALFEAVEGIRVPLPAGEFRNVNTEADRARAEEELLRDAGEGSFGA